MPGMSDSVGATPRRMSIANLVTGSSLRVQYNPVEFDEEIQVIWARLAVWGQSYQPLQYAGTMNHAPSCHLSFDALNQPPGQAYDIEFAKRWIMSLAYPQRGAATAPGGAPPDCLFVWPNFLSLRCKIGKLRFKTTAWTLAGSGTRFTVQVEFEEARDTALYSDDVLAYGSIRGALGQGADNNPNQGGT